MKPEVDNQSELRKQLVKHGLLFFIILSLILHLTGISPVIIERLIPEEDKKPQQLTAAERAALAAEQARQEEIRLMQMKQQTLREQMKQSFDSIAENVEGEVVDSVWEQVEQNVDERFEDLEQQMTQDDYNMEAFTEDYMDVSASMFEETADLMKDILRQELLKTMKEQVRDKSSEKIAEALDKRMQDYHAKREEKRLTDAARKDTRQRREQVKKDMERLKRDSEQLVQKQEELTKQEQQENSDKEKLAKKQEQLREEVEKLSERVKDVHQEMGQVTPDVAERNRDKLDSEALKKASEKQQQSSEKLKDQQSAQEDMQAALKELQQTSRDLDEVSKDMHKGEQIDEVAKAALKKIIEERMKKQVSEDFEDAMDKKLVPEATKRLVKQSKKHLDDFKMDKDAALLKKLEEEIAKELQQEVPKAMQEEAASQISQRTEDSQQLDDLGEKQLDEQTVAESKSDIENSLKGQDKQRKKEMDVTAKAAARKADLGDMSDAMQELKSKLQMMNKAEAMAKQLREGRGELGELGEMMSMMEMMEMEGEGSGHGTRPSLPFSRPGPFKGGRFNARTYQKMLDMAKARQQPGAVYEDIQREADQLVSQASEFPKSRTALIIDPREEQDEEEREKADHTEGERSVPEPAFKPIKFGWASMVKEPVVLDGELSEWDTKRKQYVNILQTSPEPTYLPDEQAAPLYMMWDHKGYYIASVVPNDKLDPVNNVKQFWVGDSIEVWMDTTNKRAQLMTYREAAQMWLWPYGNTDKPEQIAGMGHGRLGKGRIFNKGDKGIQYAVKPLSGAYQIEIFIPQTVLFGPKFEAGKYIGFQISLNSVKGGTNLAWALRVHHSWERPDTWGDVLLLGSDADVEFVRDDAGDEVLDILVPGEALRVKVHDPDMNIDPRFKDQVVAQIVGSGGVGSMLVLGETEADSGVFIGGIDTNSAYIGYQDGLLPVEPGKSVKVIYLDQRRDYGESNKKVEHEIPVSWPSLRLGKR